MQLSQSDVTLQAKQRNRRIGTSSCELINETAAEGRHKNGLIGETVAEWRHITS